MHVLKDRMAKISHLQVRIPRELHRVAKAELAKRGQSLQSFIVKQIERELINGSISSPKRKEA